MTSVELGQWLFNALAGVCIFLVQRAYMELKEEQKELRKEIDRTKENYFRKEDFRDFKQELFDRLLCLEKKLDDSMRKE